MRRVAHPSEAASRGGPSATPPSGAEGSATCGGPQMCDRQLLVGVEAVLNEAIKPSAAAGGYPCAGRDYPWTGRRGSRDPFRSTPTPRGGLALEENVLHAHNPPNEDLPRRKYVTCDPTPRRSFALDGQTMCHTAFTGLGLTWCFSTLFAHLMG